MDILDTCTSLFRSIHISIPEAVMFICFGFSWPVSVIKAIRTKKVTGKSPIFMMLVIIGYMSGVIHKIIFSRDILIGLYLFNLSMIIADLCLYLHYNGREEAKVTPFWQHGREPLRISLGDISGTDHQQPTIPPIPVSRPLYISTKSQI